MSTGAGGQEARRLQPEYEPIATAEAQLARAAELQCRAQQTARNVAAAAAWTAGAGGLRNDTGRDAAASAREEAAALVSDTSARIAQHDSIGELQSAEAKDEEWEDPSVTISHLAGTVVVTWPVVHNSGWGVFSRNLLRQMLSSGRHTPLLTVPLEVRVRACVCVSCHYLCESRPGAIWSGLMIHCKAYTQEGTVKAREGTRFAENWMRQTDRTRQRCWRRSRLRNWRSSAAGSGCCAGGFDSRRHGR